MNELRGPIRGALATAGITQTELAREAGNSQPYVTQQLGGARNLQPELVAGLLRLLARRAAPTAREIVAGELIVR